MSPLFPRISTIQNGCGPTPIPSWTATPTETRETGYTPDYCNAPKLSPLEGTIRLGWVRTVYLITVTYSSILDPGSDREEMGMGPNSLGHCQVHPQLQFFLQRISVGCYRPGLAITDDSRRDSPTLHTPPSVPCGWSVNERSFSVDQYTQPHSRGSRRRRNH